MAKSCPYPRKKKKQIAVLKQQLQEIEMKAAIQDKSTMANTLPTGKVEDRSKLGPAVFADILVNGVPAKALIDTGSPATIVSLEFVLNIYARGRDSQQSPEEWRIETQRKFTPPDVSLRNYGGHPLDMVSQTHLRLSQGSRALDTTVLVQKGAPNELLVGTDVQSKLGFALVMETAEGGVDLLTGERSGLMDSQGPEPMAQGQTASLDSQTDRNAVPDQLQPNESTMRACGPSGSPSSREPHTPGSAGGQMLEQTGRGNSSQTPRVQSRHGGKGRALGGGGQPEGQSAQALDAGEGTAEMPERETGIVRLLEAERIPAGYRKMVKTQVLGEEGASLLLFTPGCREEDILLADGALEGPCATMVITNRGRGPIHLKGGTMLGTVIPVDEVSLEEEVVCEEATVNQLEESDWGRGGGESGWQSALGPGVSSASRQKRLLEELKLQVDHLTPLQKTQLEDCLTSFADVFALGHAELGTTALTQHSIDTGDHPPIRQPPRRVSFSLRRTVDGLIKEMLSQGVIVPSSSPWASPVVLVKKKDGGMRFCVDYRQLNHITKLDEFLLPRIDETLDLLAGARFFTTLDLASGYWQVPMEASSQEKTAFTTHCGLYEFRKMPFGLVNAPATFQRLMEIVLSGLARDSCHVYLDDVLVFGKTLEEHNQNLQCVLTRVRKAGLMLKPRKCNFAQVSVEYLGHVVSAAGIQTDPKKLLAVNQSPTPTDVKSLRSFMGLASYYRRFVPGFSKVAGPLHALTKKDVAFVWSPECQQAFDHLKELLTAAPVLTFPDFQRPFILETDASGCGLGAVLAQEHPDGAVRPIAYASRSLQKHERNYGITELEGLGVVWAVKHFRPYLYGHKCSVYTDHEALKSLLNTPHPSGKLARWGLALQELDLTILHRSGKRNANADALSRFPLPDTVDDNPTCGLVAAMTPGSERDDLPALQRADEGLATVIKYLETGVLPEDQKVGRQIALTSSLYTLQDGVLYRVEGDGTLRVIPPSQLREQLFREAHGGKFGAHLSDTKVYSELRRHYWWEGMRKDITQWARGCLVCATHRAGRAVRPPLSPIPVSGPFDRIGVDVVQFPRTSRGNRYAVVFLDYLTKWPEVFAVPDQSSATVAKLLVEEVVSRHGVPSEILSDRGRTFLSGLMKEVELLLGFHKVNTTAYHPQTDGLVERYNRTLIAMLAKTVQKGGPDWDDRLPYVLFAYRASQQSSTLESPFYLVYGRDPRLPTPAVLNPKRSCMAVDLKEYGLDLYAKMTEAWEMADSTLAVHRSNRKPHMTGNPMCRCSEKEREFSCLNWLR